jgi:hypothetical protein
VNKKSVYCFHGDISDGWNAVDHSGLAKTQHDILRNLVRRSPAIAPGTELVVNHLNKVKRQLPFSDLLKPEIDVGAVLVGVIRPDFARRLPSIVSLQAQAMLREARGTEYLAQADDLTVLEGRGDLPSPGALAQNIESQINVDPLDLLDGGGETTLFFKESVKEWARRHVAKRIDKDWALGTADDPLKWVEKNRVVANLVVAGHTHMRKLVQRRDGSWYVNSGTWIDLIRLRKEQVGTPEAFGKLQQRLDTADAESLRKDPALVRPRPTWVHVESSAAGAAVRLEDPLDNGLLTEDDTPPGEGAPL